MQGTGLGYWLAFSELGKWCESVENHGIVGQNAHCSDYNKSCVEHSLGDWRNPKSKMRQSDI